jgi:hypothetical protein
MDPLKEVLEYAGAEDQTKLEAAALSFILAASGGEAEEVEASLSRLFRERGIPAVFQTARAERRSRGIVDLILSARP